MSNQSLWTNANTLFEIGLEIYRLMQKDGDPKRKSGDVSVEKITGGAVLMSDSKEILLVINREEKEKMLSSTVISYGKEKDGYLIYHGAKAAIPLFELSKTSESVRDYIISEESLRATLCGNFPDYVKAYNAIAPPGARIEDADAPAGLFLQKQLDIEAYKTRFEVADFQEAYEASHEADIFEDVLELEVG